MHFTTTTITAIFALAANVFAAPTIKSPVNIKITGLDQFGSLLNTNGKTFYLTYAKDFFGDLALLPTDDKSSALTFSVESNRTLKSTTGLAIALTPFVYDDQTTGQIGMVNYTGTEGTYVKALNKVFNSNANFSSWLACDSQYGLSLEYVSKAYNVSEQNAESLFPCYKVNFHARH